MKPYQSAQYRAAFRFAKEQTAFYSKSFFFATRLLPREKRWDVYALYGFCRYADNIVDSPRRRSSNELYAEIASLKQELKAAYKNGESEHPVIKPFIYTASKYGIPIEHPMELLDGVEKDLEKNRYENFAELYRFAYSVAGVVGLMMTYIIGFSDEKAFHYAEKLGVAMQLANILRDVQEDKRMNRIYLPLDELRQFGVDEEDILAERFSPEMQRLMAFQIRRAHRFFDEAQPGIAMLSKDGQFAVAAASRIYRGILVELEEHHGNPFLGRVFVPKSRKFIILLQEVMRSRLKPKEASVLPHPLKSCEKHLVP